MKNDGGPAFPETRWDDKTRQEVQWIGITLRDYFAAKALQGMLSGCETFPDDMHRQRFASNAYKMADAMLAERAKP